MVCAGSRLVCMVYEKYVLGLGWHIQLFPQCKAKLPECGGQHDPAEASVIMLSSLSLWLQVKTNMTGMLLSMCALKMGSEYRKKHRILRSGSFEKDSEGSWNAQG